MLLAGGAILALSGYYLPAQDELQVQHAECAYFGPKRAEFDKTGLRAEALKRYEFSKMTLDVTSKLAPLSAKEHGVRAAESNNLIDRNLFQVWRDNGITPAKKIARRSIS